MTGCKRGIGKGIALGLAEAGADIIGVSASLESSGSQIEKEVKGKSWESDKLGCEQHMKDNAQYKGVVFDCKREEHRLFLHTLAQTDISKYKGIYLRR